MTFRAMIKPFIKLFIVVFLGTINQPTNCWLTGPFVRVCFIFRGLYMSWQHQLQSGHDQRSISRPEVLAQKGSKVHRAQTETQLFPSPRCQCAEALELSKSMFPCVKRETVMLVLAFLVDKLPQSQARRSLWKQKKW